VTLIEGSIEVMENYGQRKISSVILNTVGDQASVRSAAALSSRNSLQNGIHVTQAKIDNVISWRSGVLIFTGEKLSVALYKMNLHSGHQITLKGSYLLNKPVFGVFTMGDWQQSLKAILSQYPLEVKETLENETILITDQNQKS
jgi:ferric-dicitrate binding protein FerR (iron transport regulator)